MRDFESGNSRARHLPTAAKLVYSSFCALTLLGLVTSVLLYDRVVVFGVRTTPAELYDHLIAHYSSSEPGAYEKLLQVTHFHLLTVPVLLLVSGHLLLLTRLPLKAKLVVCSIGFVSTLLHVLAPWLIFWSGSTLAWLYPISGAGLMLSLVVMTIVPVWEMWQSEVNR